MRAKTLLWAIIPLLLLILAYNANAIKFPMPINGKVIGYQVNGLTVEVKNLRTGISMTTMTNEGGEFLVEWANSYDAGGTIAYIQSGDGFRISVYQSDLTREMIYNGEPALYVVLDLGNTVICPKCEQCTPISISVIITFLLTLIVSIGGGIKIYKNKLGQAVLQHFHKGITSYHDPNISHTDIRYRHARWKDDPIKCMEDVKKINEAV